MNEIKGNINFFSESIDCGCVNKNHIIQQVTNYIWRLDCKCCGKYCYYEEDEKWHRLWMYH